MPTLAEVLTAPAPGAVHHICHACGRWATGTTFHIWPGAYGWRHGLLCVLCVTRIQLTAQRLAARRARETPE